MTKTTHLSTRSHPERGMRKAQPSLCRGTSKGLGECRERGGRREGEEERKIREKNRDRDREEEKQRGRKREVKGDRGGRERERECNPA